MYTELIEALNHWARDKNFKNKRKSISYGTHALRNDNRVFLLDSFLCICVHLNEHSRRQMPCKLCFPMFDN